jgi:hypothetical protein
MHTFHFYRSTPSKPCYSCVVLDSDPSCVGYRFITGSRACHRFGHGLRRGPNTRTPQKVEPSSLVPLLPSSTGPAFSSHSSLTAVPRFPATQRRRRTGPRIRDLVGGDHVAVCHDRAGKGLATAVPGVRASRASRNAGRWRQRSNHRPRMPRGRRPTTNEPNAPMYRSPGHDPPLPPSGGTGIVHSYTTGTAARQQASMATQALAEARNAVTALSRTALDEGTCMMTRRDFLEQARAGLTRRWGPR